MNFTTENVKKQGFFPHIQYKNIIGNTGIKKRLAIRNDQPIFWEEIPCLCSFLCSYYNTGFSKNLPNFFPSSKKKKWYKTMLKTWKSCEKKEENQHIGRKSLKKTEKFLSCLQQVVLNKS